MQIFLFQSLDTIVKFPNNELFENSKKCYFSRFIVQKRYQQIFYKPL